MTKREAHANQLIPGFDKVKTLNVLVVGAGGIGCELLKNLVMTGFKKITVIDLDTIDLSNLNRQFLFQHQHIKRPKSIVAKESVLKFNPNVDITAYHASIYEPRFGISFFQQFDMVLNALDNVAARRHVNKMCLAVQIPLIESGSAGYHGQISIHTSKTRCFDCTSKPIEKKTFPVCTIRSTPSELIHCIVWAKNYLLNALWGVDEEIVEISGENQKELETVQKENIEMKALKSRLGKPGVFKEILHKVFVKDIDRLCEMEDLWKTRMKPNTLSKIEPVKPNMEPMEFEQRTWTLQESVHVLLESMKVLTNRKSLVEFDKDDEDTLNFVTAAGNIRAYLFHIEPKSRFVVKEMAGNIIPAIATTNAIVAGLSVMCALKMVDSMGSDTFVSYGGDGQHFLMNEEIQKRNPDCVVCSNSYFEFQVGNETLGEIVEFVQSELALEGDITVQRGAQLIYDVEFDEDGIKTLEELGIKEGDELLLTNDADSDDQCFSIVLFVTKYYVLIRGNEMKLIGDFKRIPRPKMKIVEALKDTAMEQPKKKQKVVIDVDGNDAIPLD